MLGGEGTRMKKLLLGTVAALAALCAAPAAEAFVAPGFVRPVSPSAAVTTMPVPTLTHPATTALVARPTRASDLRNAGSKGLGKLGSWLGVGVGVGLVVGLVCIGGGLAVQGLLSDGGSLYLRRFVELTVFIGGIGGVGGVGVIILRPRILLSYIKYCQGLLKDFKEEEEEEKKKKPPGGGLDVKMKKSADEAIAALDKLQKKASSAADAVDDFKLTLASSVGNFRVSAALGPSDQDRAGPTASSS